MKDLLRFSSLIPVLLGAALALAGCSSTQMEGTGPGNGTTPGQAAPGWFGGYVDVTLPPGPKLQNTATGRATMVLAFITADPGRRCTPSWGGTLSLDDADSKLQLDSKIRQFRAAGNDIAVSFGGQRGQELAAACQDADAVADAYGAVINRYALDVVDLDIEGQASGPGAADVRARAIARLQAERPDGRPLRVWLTLPVARDGLSSAGKTSVQTMLDAGVELTGVNIMTMNFGPLPNGENMLSASRHAAEATYKTLEQLYSEAGKPAEAGNVWKSIGLTPMIGDNDVEGNLFSLQDAKGLNSFANEHQVGRLSLWSVNRDTACSASGKEEQQRPSVYCSGTNQEPGDFARVLSNGFTGSS